MDGHLRVAEDVDPYNRAALCGGDLILLLCPNHIPRVILSGGKVPPPNLAFRAVHTNTPMVLYGENL